MPLKFTLKPRREGHRQRRGHRPRRGAGQFLPLQQGQVPPRPRGHEGGAGRYVEKKLYLIIQLIYLFPENAAENVVDFRADLGRGGAAAAGDREKFEDVARLVQSEDYYRALKLTAKLFSTRGSEAPMEP